MGGGDAKDEDEYDPEAAPAESGGSVVPREAPEGYDLVAPLKGGGGGSSESGWKFHFEFAPPDGGAAANEAPAADGARAIGGGAI